MKPTASFLALLWASAISQTAMAEDYGLQIIGKNVTSSNCTSLFNGTVSYDPETHVLSLNNADLSSRGLTPIVNTGQDLIIDVTGTCLIASGKYGPAISSSQNLSFRGSGVLTIDPFNDSAIEMEKPDKTLSFSNCKVIIDGYSNLNGGKLVIQNSNLTTKNFRETGTCTLQGCGVKTQEVFFSPQDSCFVTRGWKDGYPFDIDFVKVTENYHFSIAGHPVNDVNAQNFYYYDVTFKQDVFGNPVDGFIKYDAEKRILTMKDATVDCRHAQPAINMHANAPQNVTLTLQGNNFFKNVSSTAGVVNFTIYNNLTINGDGSLSMEDASIWCMENSDLTIGDNVTLSAGYLYARGNGNTSKLRIGNSTFNLLGSRTKNATTIRGFASVTSQSVFVNPNAAWYDKESRSLRMFDGTPADGAVTVDRVQDYGLMLNGIMVHDKNCYNILRDIPHTGLLSYDPVRKVLLMDSLTYEANAERGDEMLFVPGSIQDFTIQLRYDNELKGFQEAHLFPQHTRIVGPGSFRAEGLLFYTGINNKFGTPQSLTIENCSLQASTWVANYCSDATLRISNAHLQMDNQFYTSIDSLVSAIIGFSTFTMERARIVSPLFYVDGEMKPPYYDTGDSRCFCSPVDGSIYNGEIIIEPVPVTVEDITILIDRYLNSEKEITVEDITNLIDEYLNADTPDVPSDPRAVDLGLSVLWASMNVGASNPEEYGDYFAWGETKPKNHYAWSTYKWCNGSSSTLTKYCTDSKLGIVDNKTVLELSDDAAHANWGGTWRMPTEDECSELIRKCTLEWITQNGVDGYRATGLNGNSIFLPAAGYYDSVGWSPYDQHGCYWSSSLYTSNNSSAYRVSILNSGFGMGGNTRNAGFSVRPVCP